MHIAGDLGTNRTPLQCIQRYQQALNNKLTKTTEWTKEEDILLKKSAEIYGSKNWQNVANMLSGRSAVQCGAKFRKSSKCRDDIVDGSWIEIDERKLFLSAVVHEIPTSSVFKKTEVEINEFLNSELIIPTTACTTVSNSTTNIDQNDSTQPVIIIKKEKKKYNMTKAPPSLSIPTAPSSLFSDSSSPHHIEDPTQNSMTDEIPDEGLVPENLKVCPTIFKMAVTNFSIDFLYLLRGMRYHLISLFFILPHPLSFSFLLHHLLPLLYRPSFLLSSYISSSP